MDKTDIIMEAKATRFTDHKEAHGKDALKLAGLSDVEVAVSPTTRKLSEIHRLVARALSLTDTVKR